MIASTKMKLKRLASKRYCAKIKPENDIFFVNTRQKNHPEQSSGWFLLFHALLFTDFVREDFEKSVSNGGIVKR